mgnify:FL=1
MKINKVALLGAGAVGAYFIWGLSEKMGENFCVVAKGERKKRLEKNGIIINGKQYSLNVKEPQILTDVDLILVCSKQDALPGMLNDIKSMVGEKTIVMSLLNGVTSEEIIGETIGMEHVLYSVMRIASIRNDNKISFNPDITAGVFVGEKGITEKTERVLAVEELFKDSRVRFTFMEDIVRDMWMKYAGNISQNLPQAVLGIGYGAYSDSTHVNFIASALWKEVAQIARAKGISIPEEFQLFVGAKPQARFSTLQDIDAKRHTEIDIFAGEMVSMRKALGIEVPYCEYTYHLIKSLEEKNDGKFDYE